MDRMPFLSSNLHNDSSRGRTAGHSLTSSKSLIQVDDLQDIWSQLGYIYFSNLYLCCFRQGAASSSPVFNLSLTPLLKFYRQSSLLVTYHQDTEGSRLAACSSTH